MHTDIYKVHFKAVCYSSDEIIFLKKDSPCLPHLYSTRHAAPEMTECKLSKVKVRVLCPIEQPGLYRDRPSVLQLVGVEPIQR